MRQEFGQVYINDRPQQLQSDNNNLKFERKKYHLQLTFPLKIPNASLTFKLSLSGVTDDLLPTVEAESHDFFPKLRAAERWLSERIGFTCVQTI